MTDDQEIKELRDREGFLTLYIQSMEAQFQELQRAYTRIKVENTILQHNIGQLTQEVEHERNSRKSDGKDSKPINTGMINNT